MVLPVSCPCVNSIALSRTWEYFPNIPSMKRNNGEFFFVAHVSAYHYCHFFLFPLNIKADRCLLTIRVIVGIPEYDISDGVSLTF